MKLKLKPVPYRWLCWIDGELPCYPFTHEKPKLQPNEWAVLRFRVRNKTCWAGWDVDRQRFICEGNKAYQLRRPKRRNRFITKIWERNHGFERH